MYEIAPLSLNFPHMKRMLAGNFSFLFFPQLYLYCKCGLVCILILFHIFACMTLNTERSNGFYQEFSNILIVLIFFTFFNFHFASREFLLQDYIISLGNYKNCHTIKHTYEFSWKTYHLQTHFPISFLQTW